MLRLLVLNGRMTFNRTIVELKFAETSGIKWSNESFNRTIVELKFQRKDMEMNINFTFNRTIVELKFVSWGASISCLGFF